MLGTLLYLALDVRALAWIAYIGLSPLLRQLAGDRYTGADPLTRAQQAVSVLVHKAVARLFVLYFTTPRAPTRRPVIATSR